MIELTESKLRHHKLFGDLTEQEWESVRPCIKKHSFHKGEIVTECGEECQRVLIIKTGQIKIFRPNANGREQTLEILLPGDTCACNPGRHEWRCSSCSIAMKDCEVWYISTFDYVNLLRKHSQMSRALNEILSDKVQRLSTLLEEISLESSQRRLIKFLLGMFDAPECTTDHHDRRGIPYNYEEIANRLGIVRETMTRHINKLKRMNLIDIMPHQIIILDRKGLEGLLI